MKKSDEVLVELDRVEIGYGRALMRPLSIKIERGEFWGVVGPNGAGKTTLVKTMLGLIKPVSGICEYPSRRPRFGYVPQRHALNPDFPLSALDIVLMGMYPSLGMGRSLCPQHKRRALEVLAMSGLDGIASRRYSSLSGGQQQRVLVARALTGDPDLLILDEPTAGMDLAGEADITEFLKGLKNRDGMTIVMVGHHLETVVQVVDHICLINWETGLFKAGVASELLETEVLTALYGRRIEVEETTGDISIKIGGRHDG